MSQITVDGVNLNFKESAFTGDQWEQVASFVLNGGGEDFDGTGLPAVTTEDNGKILVVINGKWQMVKVVDENADTMTAAQLGRAVLNAMKLASEV